MQQQANNNLNKFKAATDRASQKHPELGPALNDIVNEYSRNLPAFLQELKTLHQPNPQGVAPDRIMIKSEANAIGQKYQKSLRASITGKYGEETASAAFRAMDKELRTPGLFSGITRQFYDEDKGGFRMGGFTGALAGALIGSTFLDNGWLGVLGMVLAIIGGAMAGNKAGEFISHAFDNKRKKQPVTPVQQQQPGQAPGQTQEQAPPEQQAPGQPAPSTAAPAPEPFNLGGGAHGKGIDLKPRGAELGGGPNGEGIRQFGSGLGGGAHGEGVYQFGPGLGGGAQGEGVYQFGPGLGGGTPWFHGFPTPGYGYPFNGFGAVPQVPITGGGNRPRLPSTSGLPTFGVPTFGSHVEDEKSKTDNAIQQAVDVDPEKSGQLQHNAPDGKGGTGKKR